MPEGRLGIREEAGRSLRLGSNKYRPQAGKSQMTGRKKMRNHRGRKRELDWTRRRLATGIINNPPGSQHDNMLYRNRGAEK